MVERVGCTALEEPLARGVPARRGGDETMASRDRISPTSDAVPPPSPAGNGITGPPNPMCPERVLAPFQASLRPPRTYQLRPGSVHEIDIAETTISIHPDLPAVPAWGFGIGGHIVSPGPRLDASAGRCVGATSCRRRSVPRRRRGCPSPPRSWQIPTATSTRCRTTSAARVAHPRILQVHRSAGPRCTCTARTDPPMPTDGRTTWRRPAPTSSPPIPTATTTSISGWARSASSSGTTTTP